ncbi:EAL and HDOD domain-containing protein [Cellulomonas endophytica]|uniref:EAL and HDOD domain-containing protein n=1 Tax=Cellulomonas endophytica TaxID=2494735 RepID=UPI0010113D25|nr:HDOD domain-containing protein [Cellulomonas endophytica]
MSWTTVPAGTGRARAPWRPRRVAAAPDGPSGTATTGGTTGTGTGTLGTTGTGTTGGTTTGTTTGRAEGVSVDVRVGTGLGRAAVGSTIQRQPIVHPDRSVFGYALRAKVFGSASTAVDDRADRVRDDEYSRLDLDGLGGDRPVLLRATAGILAGTTPVPPCSYGVVLEVPHALAVRPDTAERMGALRSAGYALALGDFAGTTSQEVLLPLVDYVKIDLGLDPALVRTLAERAHDAEVVVIGERADTTARLELAAAVGADLLQGPMFARDTRPEQRGFTAGQLQCLELMQLLSSDAVDHAAVVRIVSADPELSIRVLHLINSSAFGLRRHIDSVHQAVVLVGPHQLAALATAGLVDARPTHVGPLWSMLVRARTMHALSGSDAGYTVGLLSALAAQQRVPIGEILDRTGVSADVADALRDHGGPWGALLEAVVCHEENDSEGIAATGLEPLAVAQAYLTAVPEALAIASALAVVTRS